MAAEDEKAFLLSAYIRFLGTALELAADKDLEVVVERATKRLRIIPLNSLQKLL